MTSQTIAQLESALAEANEKIFNAETATREALDTCENFPNCSSGCCPSCMRQKGSKLRAAYDQIAAELKTAHGLMNAEPMLVDTDIDENGMRFSVQHWAVRLMAASMRESLSTAPNYVEMELFDDKGRMVCTIQRREGKTPHQLRQQAENENKELREELARTREQMDSVGVGRDVYQDAMCNIGEERDSLRRRFASLRTAVLKLIEHYAYSGCENDNECDCEIHAMWRLIDEILIEDDKLTRQDP